MNLADQIYEAGIVGAGGAGFPTHVKAKSQVEFFLVNGAECEPLLHKDFEVMVNHPGEILHGVELMMEATAANKTYFCVKTKNKAAYDAIGGKIQRDNVEMFGLGDFYPSGDEYEVVHSATGRLIPAGGIPLDVDCLVANVETCLNISRAAEGRPVTEKFLSVNGIVNRPGAFFAPVGASFADIIEHVGGTTHDDFAIFVSGVMMGRLTFDVNDVITKTTAGLIILPRDHYLVRRMNRTEDQWHRIGKSACDQCRYCTEFCPRYLLGYDVQPHAVMRSLGFTKTGASMWNQLAELCCACGLCTLYACPEDLYPKEACDRSKAEMRRQGVKYVQQKPVREHLMKDPRRVPLKQLIKRLDLTRYDVATPFIADKPEPAQVRIMRKQHIGQVAIPIVSEGSSVSEGQVIGEPEPDALGAKIHASIGGTVTRITDDYIQIER